MGLSSDDFVAAFRVMSTGMCPAPALRKALRVQTSQMEKGRRISLAEALVESRAVSPAAAAQLSSSAPVDLRGDPGALAAAGSVFLETETASELELDRVIDALSSPPDPRTLKEAQVPPSLAGYDISWEVGRSRSGSVYRGTRKGTAAAVAIKVFHKEAFADDGAAQAFLDGIPMETPGDPADFVGVIEKTQADGHAVVVMEYVDGTALSALLADRKVSFRRGFEIMGRAAAALHRAGRPHGALTARSIFVGKSDRPKLAKVGWTRSGSAADDVAALGGILYEIAAGTPAFGGFRSTQLKPPSHHNSAVAGDAEGIILKALARDPARRYADPGALAEDIGRFLRREKVTADVAITETAPPTTVTIARKGRSKGWKIAFRVAAAVAISVIAFTLLRGGGDKAPSASADAAKDGTPSRSYVPPSDGRGLQQPKVEDARKAEWERRAEERRKADLVRKGPLKSLDEIDFRMRATGFLAKREFGELDKLAEEALIRGPETGWAHHYRAIAAFERDEVEKALTHCDRALALGFGLVDFFELRFEIRLARAEYRSSLEELARLYPLESVSAANQEIVRLNREIEKDARNGALFVRRGALFLHRRLPARAVEDFARATAVGETRADFFLALALKEEDRLAEAAEALKRFLATHSGIPGAAEAKAFSETLSQ